MKLHSKFYSDEERGLIFWGGTGIRTWLQHVTGRNLKGFQCK